LTRYHTPGWGPQALVLGALVRVEPEELDVYEQVVVPGRCELPKDLSLEAQLWGHREPPPLAHAHAHHPAGLVLNLVLHSRPGVACRPSEGGGYRGEASGFIQ